MNRWLAKRIKVREKLCSFLSFLTAFPDERLGGSTSLFLPRLFFPFFVCMAIHPAIFFLLQPQASLAFRFFSVETFHIWRAYHLQVKLKGLFLLSSSIRLIDCLLSLFTTPSIHRRRKKRKKNRRVFFLPLLCVLEVSKGFSYSAFTHSFSRLLILFLWFFTRTWLFLFCFYFLQLSRPPLTPCFLFLFFLTVNKHRTEASTGLRWTSFLSCLSRLSSFSSFLSVCSPFSSVAPSL